MSNTELLSNFQLSTHYALWQNERVIQKLDNFCMELIAKFVFDELFPRTDTIAEKKVRNLPIANVLHRKLLHFLFLNLMKYGYLHLEKNTYFVDKYPNKLSLIDFVKQSYMDLPDYIGILDMVTHCVGKYYALIFSQESGVQVLYPNGSFNFIQKKLQHETSGFSIVDQYLLPIVNRINSLGEHKKILEVGAGNGELTWKILRQLNVKPENYHFTDISRFFILEAKRHPDYQKYDFLTFDRLDIETSTSVACNAFDIIIAYNVLHATSDVEKALRNAHHLLKDDGLLILVELHNPFLWQHCVWGVLNGWWHFNDNYRNEIPTLSMEKWSQALLASGFEIDTYFPDNQKIELLADTCIFFARKTVCR